MQINGATEVELTQSSWWERSRALGKYASAADGEFVELRQRCIQLCSSSGPERDQRSGYGIFRDLAVPGTQFIEISAVHLKRVEF
jgi:hypothetical protein